MNYWLSKLCIIALMAGTVATTRAWVLSENNLNYWLYVSLMMWGLTAKFIHHTFTSEEIQ
jgi:hypothetical protein